MENNVVMPGVQIIYNLQNSVLLTEATNMQGSKFESALQSLNRLFKRGLKIDNGAYSEDLKCTLYPTAHIF